MFVYIHVHVHVYTLYLRNKCRHVWHNIHVCVCVCVCVCVFSRNFFKVVYTCSIVQCTQVLLYVPLLLPNMITKCFHLRVHVLCVCIPSDVMFCSVCVCVCVCVCACGVCLVYVDTYSMYTHVPVGVGVLRNTIHSCSKHQFSNIRHTMGYTHTHMYMCTYYYIHVDACDCIVCCCLSWVCDTYMYYTQCNILQ